MSYVKKLINLIQNRDLSIEDRVAIMFIAIGIVACSIGEVICIACHASIYGMIVVLAIALVTLLIINKGISRGDVEFIRRSIIVVVSILIPVVFATAGGIHSGCSAWIIYELFYITLASKDKVFPKVLVVDAIIDMLLIIADYMGVPFIIHLPSDRDVFISIFASMIVVSLAILFTVHFYKNIYNEERDYLEEKQLELAKANQFERNFLASMSHELRTPINSIMGFNDFILQSDASAKIKGYAKDVKYSSELLITKVSDILDFSSIQSGKITLENDKYNVKEFITSCYDMINTKAREKNLKLVVEADPKIPMMLSGDVNRIKQIVINILMNAVKYSEKGTITFSIGLNRYRNESGKEESDKIRLAIKIADEGIGIAEERQSAIFEPLQYMDEIKAQSVQGSGLGLALSKSLVGLMNGEILVESTVGVGSVFTVIVPQEVASSEALGDVKFEEQADSEAKSEVEEFLDKDSNGKKMILVVDDTAMNLKLMKLMLKNYEVTTVDRGAKAIDACKETKYSLILMDIMMPEMDGVEAMKLIKSECYNDVPVIAVTADAVAGAKEEYLSEGFTDYVAKPVKSAGLMSVISKYIA